MRVLVSATTLAGMATAAKMRDAGFPVTTVEDGVAIFESLDLLHRPVVILESDLPDVDWQTALAKLRREHASMTILVLNNQNSRETLREALLAGADDVIYSDITPRELGARVLSIVARRAGHSEPVLKFGAVKIDLAHKRAYWRGRDIQFSPSQYSIFELMCLSSPFVATKSVIQGELYGLDDGCELRSIDVFITQMRSRLAGVGAPRELIETSRGRGYRFVEEVALDAEFEDATLLSFPENHARAA